MEHQATNLNSNEEYFFLKGSAGLEYPMLEYVGSSAEIARDEWLDESIPRSVKFFNSGAKKPQMAEFFHFAGGPPVVAQRVKDALAEFSLKDVQFLPVSVIDQKQKQHDGFFMMRIFNKIQCLDMEKSVYKRNRFSNDPNKVANIKTLELNDALLAEVPIQERFVFSLYESSAELIFHKKVVDKLLTIAPTGMKAYHLPRVDDRSKPYTADEAGVAVAPAPKIEQKPKPTEEMKTTDPAEARQVIEKIAQGVAELEDYNELYETCGAEDTIVYEGTLTEWADKWPELTEPLRGLVRAIIQRYKKTSIYYWVNDELQAGQHLAEYLAIKNKEDIALFNEHMGAMDMEHVVGLYESIKKVVDKWEGEPEASSMEDALEYFEEVEGLGEDDDEYD